MRRGFCAALVCLLLAGGVARAGKPSVAVRDFRGPQAKRLRTGVMAALKGQVHLVKNPRIADNVVEGVVVRKGKKWKLTVTVRVAQSGSWIDDVVILLARPAVSGAARKVIARRVLALIQRDGGDAGEVALAANQRGKKKKTRAAGDDESGAASAFASDDENDGDGAKPKAETAPAAVKPKPAARDADENDGESSKPKEKQVALATPASSESAPAAAAATSAKPATDGDVARTPTATSDTVRAPGGEVFSLAAGASFQSRSFQAVGFGRLPIYKSDLYPSIYAGGTLYPLGWTRTFLRGIGFFGNFERAVGLKSRVMQTGEVFDTLAQRLEAGMLWRIHVAGPTGPTFRPMGLYGLQKFDIGGASDMPDTDYEYYGGGMDVDVPLFTPYFALTGAFQYDVISGLGGAAVFGQTATAWGYAWEAGFRADLPWRLRGVAVFTDVRRNASYTGQSSTGQTASQAHDEWIGGRVALALDF